MTIYLVRHGKDEDGFRGGWSQRGLIDEGIQQSKKLGNYLKEKKKNFRIDRIISSDLRRALDTAEYIGDNLQLSVLSSKYWRETNNGLLAGMPNEVANQKYPGLYFNSLKMDERYPGGESPMENFTRIKQAFERLCMEQVKRNQQENILIVTHGGVINIIYHILKGKEWTNKNKPFPAFHTSIHTIEYINDNWEVTQENSNAHLI
ncbi:histidine phosphatase family protein [Gracilibacillus sp. D59]|uniref:histidine phosphatase family protein n=1 Tax=Gracilibacillus sp. D59 TaxID=3457434 RepID=UPI003FCCF229